MPKSLNWQSNGPENRRRKACGFESLFRRHERKLKLPISFIQFAAEGIFPDNGEDAPRSNTTRQNSLVGRAAAARCGRAGVRIPFLAQRS